MPRKPKSAEVKQAEAVTAAIVDTPPEDAVDAAVEGAGPGPTRPVKRTTHTNWGNLVRAKIVPTTVMVQAYRPVHQSDMSPHTKIIPAAQPIIDNIRHGGGFQWTVRNAKGGWRGFVELQEAGIEITDLRCAGCGAVIPVHPQYIDQHMRPHTGSNRRVIPGKVFNVTLSTSAPVLTEDELYAEDMPDIIDV